MLQFNRYQLSNGLTVLLHEDKTTPFAAVNILYKVGSKNENPQKTGFAHLFEHLMFGGSLSVNDFDASLQRAGGESNAFTNSDITNYYEMLPANNLETALWLESDRMLQLDINQNSLDVQKKVVIEEFREHYINQPYGDVWHKLMALAYKKHPYQWPTIGKLIDHVEKAALPDVKDFFHHHYSPNNAIMVLSGNFDEDVTLKLIEKWFSNIPEQPFAPAEIPKEPEQLEERRMEVEANVPVTCIYKSYHMSNRDHPKYYPADLLTDILSNGESSRLYQALVKKEKICSDIDAYVSGTSDEGLIIIEAKMRNGEKVEEVEMKIEEQLDILCQSSVPSRELDKVKNKIESNLVFANVNLLHRAMNLAYYEYLGNAEKVNQEGEKYQAVSVDQIQNEAQTIFRKQNCSTLYYLSNQNKT